MGLFRGERANTVAINRRKNRFSEDFNILLRRYAKRWSNQIRIRFLSTRLFESKSTLSEIHVALCKDNAIELIKGAILKKLPHGIGDIITKEKYFVIMN